MATRKSNKQTKEKKPTKSQLTQAKKLALLEKIGEGLAGTYSEDELEDISIELINNRADIKDTLLITFLDSKTGNTAEQWKLTLVKKTKNWEYGEDYLDEDITKTFGVETDEEDEETEALPLEQTIETEKDIIDNIE